VTIDTEGKSSETILEELKKIAAKPETQVRREQSEVIVNVANFKQVKNGRRCICEVPGQVPCPKLVPIPNVHHSWHNTGTETSV
jgi:small subunit ribosomal protein S25